MDLNNLEVEKNLKIVYMGTPDFSATVLKGLVENYKVRAVVSQPDRMVGRNKEVRLTPVKQVANDNTILVIQPEKIKEAVDEVLAFEPDLIITCAYGQIIPKAILDYPRLGCINVHASLLPKLRGGAPIHRCILEGHSKTGITIMYMSEKMDAGDMIMQREIEIENEDTAETLHDKLSILGRDLLLEVLPSIINGTNERTKEDEKLDFNKTSRQIYNHIRGLNSWPGAYTKLDGKILKIWSSRFSDNVPQGFNGTITAIYKDGFGVKTANGEIVVTEVQMEGKKRMSGADFANGYKDLVGKMLS